MSVILRKPFLPAFQQILVLLRTLVVPSALDCLYSQKTPKCFQVYVFQERNHHSAPQDVLHDFKYGGCCSLIIFQCW